MRRSDMSQDIHSKYSAADDADSSRSDHGMADRDPKERDRYDPSISAPLPEIDTMVGAYEGGTSEAERRVFLRAIARGLEVVTGQLHDRIGALVDALTEDEK
jgi:hypothetical protein